MMTGRTNYSSSLVVLMIILLLSSLGRTRATDQLLLDSCSEIAEALAPCTPFVKGNAKAPSQSCCGGAYHVASQAKTKEILHQLCRCLQAALLTITPYDPNRVPQVTSRCGINLMLPPIDESTNCSALGVME